MRKKVQITHLLEYSSIFERYFKPTKKRIIGAINTKLIHNNDIMTSLHIFVSHPLIRESILHPSNSQWEQRFQARRISKVLEDLGCSVCYHADKEAFIRYSGQKQLYRKLIFQRYWLCWCSCAPSSELVHLIFYFCLFGWAWPMGFWTDPAWPMGISK